MVTTSLALLSFPSTFISLFYESKEKVDTCIGEGNILGARLQSKAESYVRRLLFEATSKHLKCFIAIWERQQEQVGVHLVFFQCFQTIFQSLPIAFPACSGDTS